MYGKPEVTPVSLKIVSSVWVCRFLKDYPSIFCSWGVMVTHTTKLLLTHPYFEHPVGIETHADGKHGERALFE